MVKKEEKLNPVKNLLSLGKHPILHKKWNLGQRAADKLTSGMGSWIFIILFLLFILVWVIINTYFLIKYQQGQPFDPYPFILLNLILSCLAAIQAPIILMSQNREAQKDRLKSEYDYQVNRKALKQVSELQKQLNKIEKKLTR